MPQSELVQSVLKALDVVALLSASGAGMRLNEIAPALDCKKTTVFNLLRTLAARGYVVKDGMNRYALGPAIIEIGRQQLRHGVLVRGAERMRLVHKFFPGAVLTFTELTPTAAVCRLRMSPDRPGEIQRPLDRAFPPYTSVSAICLQAFSSTAREFEKNYPFEEYGLARWGTREAYLQNKARIREQGYYLSERHAAGVHIAFVLTDNFVLGVAQDENLPASYRSVISGLLEGFTGVGLDSDSE